MAILSLELLNQPDYLLSRLLKSAIVYESSFSKIRKKIYKKWILFTVLHMTELE